MVTGVKQAMPGVVYPPEWHIEKYTRLGVLGDRGLIEALIESMEEYADRCALITADREYSYRELNEHSTCFAAALMDLGLQPLDRVVFQVVNSYALVVGLLACWKANLIPVCTLAAHREREIHFLAEHSGAVAHFIGIEDNFDFPGFAAGLRRAVPTVQHTIVLKGDSDSGFPHMEDLARSVSLENAAARVAAVERDPFQVCVFQLSGGTTSVPKIIPRFSNEYLYNMERCVVHNEYRDDDVALVPLQLIHNGSMVAFTFPLMLVGARSVLPASMDPASMVGAMLEHKPTIFGLTAAAVGRLKEFGLLEALDLERARLIISANAARQIEAVLGKPACHIFGMTEGLVAFGRRSDPEQARIGTVGQPVSIHDEIKIVKPGTSEELPVGETGEMICRGPYTIFGYYDAEDRNKEAFTEEGYYRSGDLMAARDIDGEIYYSYEGRIKDVVDRGGEKINCEEVEHVARTHPAIHDIAIVPMPDPEMGERACAFIVPAADQSVPTVKELAAFLVSEGLAKYKCPERIESLDEFPLTSANKLDKPALKRMIAERLSKDAA